MCEDEQGWTVITRMKEKYGKCRFRTPIIVIYRLIPFMESTYLSPSVVAFPLNEIYRLVASHPWQKWWWTIRYNIKAKQFSCSKIVTFRYLVGVVTLKMHKRKRSLAVSKKKRFRKSRYCQHRYFPSLTSINTLVVNENLISTLGERTSPSVFGRSFSRRTLGW